MPEHSLMRRARRVPDLAAMIVPLALLLAACGSSGGASPRPTETTSAAATPTATTRHDDHHAVHRHEHDHDDQHDDHAAPAAARQPCRAADLTLSFVGQQGGMGHGEIGFALRNTGNRSCRTYG